MYLTEPLPQMVISKLAGWPLAAVIIALILGIAWALVTLWKHSS